FRSALEQTTNTATMTGAGGAVGMTRTQVGHIAAGNDANRTHPTLLYRTPTQTALDANNVDLDTERGAFVDNSVRYEASLRFINTQIHTLMTAINGGQGS